MADSDTTFDPQAKITMQELADMFRDEMPIAAVDLIFNAPDDMIIGQIGAKLRDMA